MNAKAPPKPTSSRNVAFMLRGEPSRLAGVGDVISVAARDQDGMLVRISKQSVDASKPARTMTIALDRAGSVALGRYLIAAGQQLTAMAKPQQSAEARIVVNNIIAGEDVFTTVSAREMTREIMIDVVTQNCAPRDIRTCASALVDREDAEAFARALLVLAMDR